MSKKSTTKEYPVFPYVTPATHKSPAHISRGMSLRAYFAGLAMSGLLAGDQTNIDTHGACKLADEAVAIADAMISALEQ